MKPEQETVKINPWAMMGHIAELYADNENPEIARQIYIGVTSDYPGVDTPEKFDQWDAWRVYRLTVWEHKGVLAGHYTNISWQDASKAEWEQKTRDLE